jgi:hypothetical protein
MTYTRMFEQANEGMYIFQTTKITLLNVTYHSIYYHTSFQDPVSGLSDITVAPTLQIRAFATLLFLTT